MSINTYINHHPNRLKLSSTHKENVTSMLGTTFMPQTSNQTNQNRKGKRKEVPTSWHAFSLKKLTNQTWLEDQGSCSPLLGRESSENRRKFGWKMSLETDKLDLKRRQLEKCTCTGVHLSCTVVHDRKIRKIPFSHARIQILPTRSMHKPPNSRKTSISPQNFLTTL